MTRSLPERTRQTAQERREHRLVWFARSGNKAARQRRASVHHCPLDSVRCVACAGVLSVLCCVVCSALYKMHRIEDRGLWDTENVAGLRVVAHARDHRKAGKGRSGSVGVRELGCLGQTWGSSALGPKHLGTIPTVHFTVGVSLSPLPTLAHPVIPRLNSDSIP